MSDYLDINNEELLKDFFTEAEQQVENLESNILVIENDPTNHDAIDEIFRAAHTLKGGSATVEFTELSSFTHTVEDVLDELRSDRLQVTEPVVDVLLETKPFPIESFFNELGVDAREGMSHSDSYQLISNNINIGMID